jgi:hypothetical protein
MHFNAEESSMKKTLVLAALLPLVAMPAAAQHWTPEEQEIIDLNQACWDAGAAEDLDAVRRTCNEHEDGRSWLTSEAAPAVGWFVANAERSAAAFDSRREWLYWEVRPLSVRLFGETALIHFWATRTIEGTNGTETTLAHKQLNIWQRIDGRWTWIGGMADVESGSS